MTTLIDETLGNIDGGIGIPGHGHSIEVATGTASRLVATRATSATKNRRLLRV